MTGRRIAFVGFDGMKLLDVSGPAEVFAEADRFGADYSLTYVSPSGESPLTSVGTRLHVDGAARDQDDVDTAIISGGDLLPTTPIPAELTVAVRHMHAHARRLVSVCTGSFALAAAGVLAGHRATTHWRHASLLARAYPDIQVEPDSLYVEDRAIFTSAGVSAGIDLALALVERDHGPDLARDVARNLVMFMRRPGGQSQFSAPLEIQPPRTPALWAVLDLICAQPALDHSVTTLAAQVNVSPRHLARLFAAELGTSPAKFVERTRLDHARALLDSGHSVATTARIVGFGSAETMRRLFIARLGVTPSQYRARFATTGSSGPA